MYSDSCITTRSNRYLLVTSGLGDALDGLLSRFAPCEATPSLARETDSASLQQSRERPLALDKAPWSLLPSQILLSAALDRLNLTKFEVL